MLETRIAELTAAVEALTKAIGGMQDPGPVNAVTASLEWVKPPKEVPNVVAEEAKKSPAISSTSQTSSPESAAVTYDDVKKATNAVSGKFGRDKALAGLQRFGVTGAMKLTEAQWPEYVAYMTRVAAGEIDPEASHE